ncbi:MAG: TIGR00730 family Rossman fold protein [bacterium]|nr:TIGR00730 family Rossman fold protein [bacterium]
MNQNRIQRICVFCGSRLGKDAIYRQAAFELGRALALRGYGLVYGGSHVGLMGVIADAVINNGGEVDGVIPEPMVSRELAHLEITRRHVVGSMHERKARMAELSDAFIAMPGGFGTFEELFEIITWAQLGIHHKPIGLLNINGYFNPLQDLIEQSIKEDFVKPEHRHLTFLQDQPGAMLDAIERHRMPPTRPWL